MENGASQINFSLFDGTMKIRAKSLEAVNFFEKFGYSNICIPIEDGLEVKNNVNAEEEIDDNSTNAPESRTISLRSECDIDNQNAKTQKCDAKTDAEIFMGRKQEKKKIKVNNIISQMLSKTINDADFSERFKNLEHLNEGEEIWEF